ncbi:MAG: ribonuclease HII [Clostridia bacterium]|nr:ribonuclease HII [Clostridia bacterium]
MAKAKKETAPLVFHDPFADSPYHLICGVDEAGRGPLCGPVVAAACILPSDCTIEGLNDSKKLTEKKRERLFDIIKDCALTYCIAMSTVEEINSINILEASLLAMRRAIGGLCPVAQAAWIDGNVERDFPLPARAVIHGDALVPAISAASILAKVSRDRMCPALDAQYPQYGIAKHKGYGTAVHIAALKEHGPSPIHRTRFIRFLHEGAEDEGAADTAAIAAAHLPDASAFFSKDGSVSPYILDYKHNGSLPS